MRLRARILLVNVLAIACLSACGDDAGGGPDGGGSGGDGAATIDGRGAGDAPDVPGGSACDPLPAATGATAVSPADDLAQLVYDAAPGTTFVLADGTYALSATLQVHAAGVTLRSASGDPSAVVLDGGYTVNEVIAITADDVTIAELTVTRAVDHPIHISPAAGADLLRPRLYRLRLIDGGEQFLKVNLNADQVGRPIEGRVECSLFVMTDAGRPHVERDPGGCYTGGLDAHGAVDWVVARNRFEGIYCETEGLAEHAVHFWTGSSGMVVEQNVIVDCARGIGFGLGNDLARGTTGGLIRNNVVWTDLAAYDTGIGLEHAAGAKVLHNTVISSDAHPGYTSIDLRFATTDAEVVNNLVRNIVVREGAAPSISAANLEAAPSSLFVSGDPGEAHLAAAASQAIDQGVADADAGFDLDGEPHTAGAAPDLGADER